MTLRNKDQSMGIWINEVILSHPDKLDGAVRDLAQSGYGIVRVFLRNSNFNHRSPQVVAGVARIVKTAHAAGLRAVLDCEPHGLEANDMGNLFPESMGCRVVRAETAVVNGRFVLHVPSPPTTGERGDFQGVEAAFVQEGGRVRKLEKFEYTHRVVGEPYRNGFTTREHTYTEGRPGAHGLVLHLSGTLAGVTQGRVIVYVRFFDPKVIDFWAPGVRAYYDQLLECYRGIPLDGAGWDEPAIGGDWNQYLFGTHYAAAFARRNGYPLADKWYLLDDSSVTPEAVRVRLDYYRTLNEGLFEAQRHLFQKARELFGPDLLGGTHHTWQGEGGINDYRAGAVDYFRLNENMEAGYTDCWWWDPKSVSYAYTLASSLGRLTASGEAVVNTWDTKANNSRVEYNARLMTLMDITWFNIWYGESTDTSLYPADYTWPTVVREMQRHRDAVRLLGKAKPVVEIAMLHGWETVCGVNTTGIAAAHKAFCLNTAKMMIDHSVAFDWIDTSLLAASKVANGRLINALGSFAILVLPYAAVLPRAAWEKCRELARGGGKIIFVGTPVEMDTAGQLLRDEFAQLLDMPVLTLERYLAALTAVCTLPLDRPENLDVCVPLDGEESRLLISLENERHGVRNATGNVIYISDLDPRERLLHLLEAWLTPEVTCHSASIQWRLYRDGPRAILVCIARRDSQLRGLIRWGKHEVEFSAGTVALIETVAGELKIHGDKLKWNAVGK